MNSTSILVAGNFTAAVNSNGIAVPNTKYIAKWDSSTKLWSAFSNGLIGPLNSICVDVSNNVTYIGGMFNNVNNASGVAVLGTRYIAKRS